MEDIVKSNITKIKNIIKKDKTKSINNLYSNEEFDYLVVNKNSPINYISGNLMYMNYCLPILLDTHYNFSDNEVIRMYEVYSILTHQIILTDFNVINIDMYYKQIHTDKTLTNIKVKKRTIDFNHINQTKLKKYFSDKSKLQSFLTEKLKLKNVFYHYNIEYLLYGLEMTTDNIVKPKDKYNSFIKRNNSEIFNVVSS